MTVLWFFSEFRRPVINEFHARKLVGVLLFAIMAASTARGQGVVPTSDRPEPNPAWIYVGPSLNLQSGYNSVPFAGAQFDVLLRKAMLEHMHHIGGMAPTLAESDVFFYSYYKCSGVTCSFMLNIGIARPGFEYWNYRQNGGGNVAIANVDTTEPQFLNKAAETLADKLELYRIQAEKDRAEQELRAAKEAQRKEDRARRHSEYVAQEQRARQQMAKYNETSSRQATHHVSVADESKRADVSDATTFQIFLGLRPSTVISRCGRPTSDKMETRTRPVSSTIRTLIYSTPRYGQVTTRFMTLSPTPTADNLSFSGLQLEMAGGTRSLIPAEPNDRKLILGVLPCLIPATSSAAGTAPATEATLPLSMPGQPQTELTSCPIGSRHPGPELQTTNGKQRLAFRAECILDSPTVKVYSDCPGRFAFDRPGRCIAELDKCPVGWDDIWVNDGRSMWCFADEQK